MLFTTTSKMKRALALTIIIGSYAAVIVPKSASAAETRTDKSESTTPAPTQSADGLTRDEIERGKRAAAAKDFNDQRKQAEAAQKKPGTETSTAAAVKPKSKKPSQRLVSSGEETAHQYSGLIGNASINLTMTVYKGKVNGDFYFLRAPTTLYTFSGENPKEGLLTLKIDSDGVQFADTKLTKDPRIKNSILWDGKLHTVDDQTQRLLLNRPLKPETAPEWPASLEEFEKLKGYERYEGSVTDERGGKAAAVFKLRFTGIKCEGFYYQIYPSRKISYIFRLEGQNPTKGVLTLREFDDEGMSAELYLEKQPMSGNVVSWEGKMTNHRFNQAVKTVQFQHTLKP